MDEWFTFEQIDKNTFAISEYKHWEETHCYLLFGTKKALLIDTGLGVSNIREAVKELTALPIEAVTTHVHWDHIGGHQYFKNIAVFEGEKSWLSGSFPLPLWVVKTNLQSKPCEFPADFDIEKYHIYQGGANVILHDDDIIDLGNRRLRTIHTPGHSPGHICFYETDRQYLFSGDLIYAGCLDVFYPTTDPQQFMRSVKRVKALPIRRILPAHHQLNIPVTLIDEIDNGFEKLLAAGNLIQGKGIFTFEHFQIHI